MTQYRFGRDHIGNRVFGIMGQENKSPLKSAISCIADAYAKEMDDLLHRNIFNVPGVSGAQGQSQQKQFDSNHPPVPFFITDEDVTVQPITFDFEKETP